MLHPAEGRTQHFPMHLNKKKPLEQVEDKPEGALNKQCGSSAQRINAQDRNTSEVQCCSSPLAWHGRTSAFSSEKGPKLWPDGPQQPLTARPADLEHRSRGQAPWPMAQPGPWCRGPCHCPDRLPCSLLQAGPCQPAACGARQAPWLGTHHPPAPSIRSPGQRKLLIKPRFIIRKFCLVLIKP